MRITLSKFILPALALTVVLALSACGGEADSAGSSSADSSSAPSPTTSASDSSAPSDPTHNDADAVFAAAMMPHHQQAVEMADLATSRASSEKVKDLATRIRAAQGPEITAMNGWLKQWGAAMPTESGMDSMEGMDDLPGGGMMSGQGMKALEQATGKEFDVAFLTGMLAHHQGAVEMANTELSTGKDPAAKALAQSIVTSQSQEISEIQTLLAQLKG